MPDPPGNFPQGKNDGLMILVSHETNSISVIVVAISELSSSFQEMKQNVSSWLTALEENTKVNSKSRSQDLTNRLLVAMEELKGRLTTMEQENRLLKEELTLLEKNNSLTHGKDHSPSYASVSKVRNETTSNTLPTTTSLPPIPPNSFINQFKTGQVVIHTKFGNPKPFEGQSAAVISS